VPILACGLLSLVVAWVRGVSPLRLGSVQLRWLLLPVLAFATQVLAFGRFGSAAAPYATWLQLGSMGLLIAFLLANIRYRSVLLIVAGVALNLLAVSVNGGYMPVRITDVERIGFPDVAAQLRDGGRYQKSVPLDERTRLPWLADVIHLPLPGPDRMVSIGDVLVAAGTFLFVQEALVGAGRGSRIAT
jgi:hypothetical protein